MQEFFSGFGAVCLYYVIFASVALISRVFIKIPDEIFRKILHFILIGSFPVYLYAFETWWISALAAVIFAVIVFPVLFFFERFKKYSEFVTERKKGELKSSLLLVFAMFAIVISVCVGIFSDRYIALASILAWGIGDALAALIGKKFGKHKINIKHTDGKKSIEGTSAMFVCAVLSVLVVLISRGGISPIGYVIIPLITGVVSATAELYCKNGVDTFVCPVSSMITIIPLTFLFGGVL